MNTTNERFWQSLDINMLSAECLDYLSSFYSFSDELGVKWDVVFPDNIDDEEDIDYDGFYPMMNFVYPLPENMEFDGQDADRLEYLPLTIVMFFAKDEYDRYSEVERYSLALTGGGMDLSWEICEAYIRLGFLPPVSMCELPRMGGMKFDAKTQKILNACELSLIVGRERNVRAIKRINDVRHWVEDNE